MAGSGTTGSLALATTDSSTSTIPADNGGAGTTGSSAPATTDSLGIDTDVTTTDSLTIASNMAGSGTTDSLALATTDTLTDSSTIAANMAGSGTTDSLAFATTDSSTIPTNMAGSGTTDSFALATTNSLEISATDLATSDSLTPAIDMVLTQSNSNLETINSTVTNQIQFIQQSLQW